MAYPEYCGQCAIARKRRENKAKEKLLEGQKTLEDVRNQ